VGNPGGGATYAVIEYGYEENEPTRGTIFPPTVNYYCAQYQAKCYVNGGGGTPSYTAAGATHYTLSTVPKISIGIPQRVLAYNVIYYNASNNPTGASSGLQFLATDPAALSGYASPPAYSPPGATYGSGQSVTISSSAATIICWNTTGAAI